MINKKNLWFLTLFSLVLVLSVYYVTMPNELLINGNGYIDMTGKTAKNDDKEVDAIVTESDIITALRVEDNDKVLEEMNALKKILTDLNVTVEQKNKAFEDLKGLNLKKGKEEELSNLIKKEYKVEAFIKIDGNQIRVVVGSKEHSATLANDIMRLIQKEFTDKMYITVKFQGN